MHLSWCYFNSKLDRFKDLCLTTERIASVIPGVLINKYAKGKKHYKMTSKAQSKRSEYSSPTTSIGKSNLQAMLVSKKYSVFVSDVCKSVR